MTWVGNFSCTGELDLIGSRKDGVSVSSHELGSRDDANLGKRSRVTARDVSRRDSCWRREGRKGKKRGRERKWL